MCRLWFSEWRPGLDFRVRETVDLVLPRLVEESANSERRPSTSRRASPAHSFYKNRPQFTNNRYIKGFPYWKFICPPGEATYNSLGNTDKCKQSRHPNPWVWPSLSFTLIVYRLRYAWFILVGKISPTEHIDLREWPFLNIFSCVFLFHFNLRSAQCSTYPLFAE